MAFLSSAACIGLGVVAWLTFNGSRLLTWVIEEPGHTAIAVRIAAAAVVGKYWLAAYAWREVDVRYLRQYLWVWVAGTSVIGALLLTLWNMMRLYVALDIDAFQSLLILLALLAVPVARVGVAPASLARNRHR